MIDTDNLRHDISVFGSAGVADEDILALCDEIDRLRAGKPKPEGKTAHVIINVAVDHVGMFAVGQDNFKFLLEPRAYYSLTAYLPIPEEVTVAATVEGE